MEEGSIKNNLRKANNYSSLKRECYIERTYRFQTLRMHIFRAESPPFILFVTQTTWKELKLSGVPTRKIHMVDSNETLSHSDQWICIPAEKSKMSHEEMFEKLCKENKSSRALHWVCVLDGAIVWKKSIGTVTDLIPFVNSKCKLMSMPYTELSIANERVVVLADEIGAGKSSLMCSIARKLAEESPLSRVFKLNLKILATGRENHFHLSEISCQTNETEKALGIMAKMINFRDHADETDFINCCNRGSPAIALIFDGFDEINRECQEKVLKLLKLLKDGSQVLIWVTTRFGEQVDLEINLETLAVSLQPLSKNQKISYLNKYWKLKLKDFLNVCEMDSMENLRSYLREMMGEIEICMLTLPEKKRQFQILIIMNSLSQIVSMIIKLQSEGDKLGEDSAAMICEQINSLDFSGYAKVLLTLEQIMNDEDDSQYISTPLNLSLMAEMTFDAKFQLPGITNINSLYEKFIETKYSNFYKKKNKNTNWSGIYSSPEYFAHKEIALELLLPDETSTISLNWTEKVEQELLEEIGLVTLDERGFQFIHHMFTEYFFCDWVVTDLSNEEVQKVLVRRILSEPNCSASRKFLNLQIEGRQISIPLTGKILEDANIFGSHDSTGTFLHLMTEECLGSILEMFFNTFPYETADIILKTNSNLQNVLHIACDLCFNRIIEIILNFAKNHLPKEKTERLILQKDSFDESPFECLYGKCFLKLFIDFLHDNNRKISDEVCSYFLEVNLCDPETNILTKHLLVEYPDTVDKLFELAFNKLSQEQYLDLIINQIDIHGNTCLLNLAFAGTPDNLFHFWEYAGKTLPEESLREYLLRQNACGNTVMHEAALGSNDSVFHQLLQHTKLLMTEDVTVKHFLSAVNVEGNTVLHEAVSKSKVQFLQQLLDTMDEEVDHETLKDLLTQTNRSLDTVLHLAARRGEVDIMEQVCSYVKDVLSEETLQKLLLAKNSKGFTAFHAAVEKGSADTLRILWECAEILDKESLEGCLTDTNKYGNSMFHSATAGTAAYVLKLLLEYAVSVLDKDSLPRILTQDNVDGNNVLHVASVSCLVEMATYWFDFASLAVSRNDLKEAITQLNGDGDNILHLAMKRGEMTVLQLTCSQIKELLGEEFYREFLVTTDRHEHTLLHLAVSRRVDEILLYLLEFMKGELESEYLEELIKQANDDGETIFHFGVATGSTRIMEIIYNFIGNILGDLDIKDLLTKLNVNGKTALQLAYDKGDFEAIKQLCELSSEALSNESLLEFLMNINSFGETFLQLAVHLEGTDRMTEWCTFVKTLLNPSSMELLFMVPNQNGDTVLHYVVRLRNSDVILFWFDLAKEILSAECMKDILKKRNNMGDTILHFVSSVEDTSIVRYVCQHLKQFQGGETLKWMLMQQNKNGESILHLIVRKSELAIVTFWLDFIKGELGVEFLSEILPEANSNGESVLHIAILRDDVDIVKHLCIFAVDVLDKSVAVEFLTRKVKSGSNLLHLIVTRGNIIMMKEFWECCESILDKKALEAFILETNGGDDTLLHLATTRGKISMLNQTFIYMKDYLSKGSVKDIMMKRNFEGNVNLHIAVSKGRLDLLTRLWDWHNELLNDDSSDEFILCTTSRGCTVLHLATLRGEITFLNQLCEWCEEKLNKESLRILVLLPDRNGSTCLHLASKDGETAIVNRIFDYAKSALEEQQLESFFKKPNENMDTVLHIGVRRGKLSITMYLCEYAKQILRPASIKRLLTRPNCLGKTIMDEAMLQDRNYYVESLWEYANAESKDETRENDYKNRKAARVNECSSF